MYYDYCDLGEIMFEMGYKRYKTPTSIRPFKMSFDDSIMRNHSKCFQTECPTLWVFGYGSLLWKPGFEFDSYEVGYIENYERRFNQGNETFRGTPTNPGRVANLEKKKGSKVWGVAFQICGKDAVMCVLRNLYEREIAGGGYDVMMTTFHPRQQNSQCKISCHPYSCVSKSPLSHGNNEQNVSPCHLLPSLSECQGQNFDQLDHIQRHSQPQPSLSNNLQTDAKNLDENNTMCELKNCDIINNTPVSLNKDSRGGSEESFGHSATRKPLQELDQNTQKASCVQVLVFTPTKDNTLYLGPDSIRKMARQIVDAKGLAGSNIDYVLKTTDFIRKYIPEDNDLFLFDLDAKIREELSWMRQNE